MAERITAPQQKQLDEDIDSLARYASVIGQEDRLPVSKEFAAEIRRVLAALENFRLYGEHAACHDRELTLRQQIEDAESDLDDLAGRLEAAQSALGRTRKRLAKRP